MYIHFGFVIAVLCFVTGVASAAAPYPPSERVHGMIFDLSSVEQLAPGSDNWPVTWADDNHQYTSWGDGGGFGGTNNLGRVSLGVARIEGSADRHRGFNVWGGHNTANPANVNGKSTGILSVDGVLYMWVTPGSGHHGFEEARLYTSSDHAATWDRQPEPAFVKADKVIKPTFAQFGRDYDGARDEYVYIYAARLKNDSQLAVQKPGEIDLIRVPKYAITDRDRYEFYAGTEANGRPKWSPDLPDRQPVFEDANGVGWTVSVSYNAGLDRYFLITEHNQSFSGDMGVFDAPEPWGPWTTVEYSNNLAGLGTTFFWNFSNKWLSEDGRDFVLNFTGIGANDAWGTVRGTFNTPEPTSLAVLGVLGMALMRRRVRRVVVMNRSGAVPG